jgi:hypothetical protein
MKTIDQDGRPAPNDYNQHRELPAARTSRRVYIDAGESGMSLAYTLLVFLVALVVILGSASLLLGGG